MTLNQYVTKRNGVPIGDNKSLQNMLSRSLGAGQFPKFWHYWNPIWSFYLGTYIFRPVRRVVSIPIARFITFVSCGFIHDLAIMAIKQEYSILLTLWFAWMGLFIVFTSYIKVDYSSYPWPIRAFINIGIIVSCYWLARLILP